MIHPSGRIYWTIVSLFSYAQYVLDQNEAQVAQLLDSIP